MLTKGERLKKKHAKNNQMLVKKDSYIYKAFERALKYYPELKDEDIRLRLWPISSSMQAWPRRRFFLRSKKNRRYTLLINNNKGPRKGLSIDDIPFKALVGKFGHELAHIVDYKNMNNLQIVIFTFKYLNFAKYRRRVETRTDLSAIKHGLGNELKLAREYVLNEEGLWKRYTNSLDKD